MIRLQIFGPLKKLVLDSFSYFKIFFINTFPQLQTGSEIIFKFFSEMAFWFLLCWLLANLFGLITPEIHNVDYQKNLPEKSGGKKLFYPLKDTLFKYFIKEKKVILFIMIRQFIESYQQRIYLLKIVYPDNKQASINYEGF